ncbi:hypothetical protein NLX83_29965 [Allokutzneria sp. A3M-2-11 16]|uniref:hypothetical protein n=1 Tax=Allokutzneria sp. A3M-2-11 16 TaxID=2962043 RepID=UPI0020B81D95|nr:hypothetical protein [Allokutzneria sp. A3M-2-11 16]MCP3803505.1 hypothetical protein [Allokutzneria sp. A3M-2-11 16]
MVKERLGRLCLNLARDPGLSAVLDDAGLPAEHWDALADAVRAGADPDALTRVLDAVEEAAAAAGIDGLTSTDRRFQPLPGAASGVRVAHGWRCPHAHPCGRVEVRADGAPECSLTADPLTPVKVVSG